MFLRRLAFLTIVAFGLVGAIALPNLSAQALPVFRIGILDNERGALLQGARLALEEINASGGVRGADGTFFRLELVVQPADNLTFANSVNNLAQASLIAVIGPERSSDALANLSALQTLGIPVLTTATDDTLLAIDTTDLVLRIRAQEALQGRALASYFVNDLALSNIATVQLDLESTASVVGFSTALSAFGVPVQQAFLLDSNNPILRIANAVTQNNYRAIAVYGPPSLASELYTSLRASDWGGLFYYNRASSTEFREAVAQQTLEGVLGTTTWSYANTDIESQSFVQAYIRAYGEIPSEIAAAAYDGVALLAEAIGKPGALLNNLYSISGFVGVQGVLSPATLTRGETSNNVSIVRLGTFGAPAPVARFAGTQRVTETDSPFVRATNTPQPTATPDGVFVAITREVQNVRMGPSTVYDVLGQVRRGETFQVIGANLNFTWVAISFRGQTGWLSADILDIVGNRNTVPLLQAPPTPTPPPATATPTAQPFPDIVILSASPSRLTLGAPFAISVTVANNGAVNAGPFAVAASLTPGNIFSALNLPGLAAGQQTIISLTGTLGTGASGSQNVTIVADLNNEVSEGPIGEANNSAFTYNYIADAPLLSGTPTGTVTIGDLATFTLDGGSVDIQWGGGGLVPLAGTQIVILGGYSNLEQVHYDAIVAAPLSGSIIAPITAGQVIAIKTDGGNKFGVLFINAATSGGNLTFTFRMYN